MQCPNCGLTNPETAQRCDCGYDFLSTTIEEPYYKEKIDPSLRGVEREKLRLETVGPSKRTKTVAIVGFILVTLVLWLPTIVHNFAGFVVPANPQAIGFDTVTLLVWAAFLYAARNLWRVFRKDT